MSRPTQAVISRSALRHNAAIARQLAPHSQLMAVIKANAYGHGATAVAHALADHVDALAVACLEEALELRSAGTTLPILLLEGIFEPQELAVAAKAQLWITIENEEQLAWLERAKMPTPVQCWIKVDTGMHRLGFAPDAAGAALARLANSRNAAQAPVLFTHFADAETIGSEATATALAQFNAISTDAPRSACNSAALLTLPQAHFDWVRPGYLLYGNSPLDDPQENTRNLQPVMTLRSAISALRTIEAGQAVGYGCTWRADRRSIIATVPIGYGDGYPRSAPAGTPVLVGGKRVPLAGRVSMDMLTLDVTDLETVSLGDAVILWGAELPLREIASHAGTNGYELTTRMPQRTPRIIIDE